MGAVIFGISGASHKLRLSSRDSRVEDMKECHRPKTHKDLRAVLCSIEY